MGRKSGWLSEWLIGWVVDWVSGWLSEYRTPNVEYRIMNCWSQWPNDAQQMTNDAQQMTQCREANAWKQESPAVSCEASYKIWHRPTLPRITAVPSALAGLTSLFGMGRGGHRRYRHLNIFIDRSIEIWDLRLIYIRLFSLWAGPWVSYLTSHVSYLRHYWKKSFWKEEQQYHYLLLFCWARNEFRTLNSTRRKLRVISITRLWCCHL